MRGTLLKGFFRCRALSSAPNGWPRKRRKSFPLPQPKRRKLTAPTFAQQAIIQDDDASEEDTLDEGMLSEESLDISEGVPEELSEFRVKPINVLDVSSAPKGKEKSSLYPSVVYEGNVALVKLGVGQMSLFARALNLLKLSPLNRGMYPEMKDQEGQN